MLNSLQAGRALAAIIVAAFHLSVMMGEARYGGRAQFLEYTRLGYLGVEFFFVLSGFIILFAHEADLGRPQRWGAYLWRRFSRLYPVYWIYTGIFMLLVALGAGTAARLPATGMDYVSALTLVHFTTAMPPLPVAWSLFHEVAFYAVFSLLILRISLGVAGFVLMCVPAIVFFHHPIEAYSTVFEIYTGTPNLYFVLGMAAFLQYRRGGSGLWELMLGLAIVAASLASLDLEPRLAPLVLVCGFALALAGIAKFEKAGRLAVPALLVFIGNATYSLYLIHESVSGLLLKVLMRSGVYTALGSAITYGLVLAATVAGGCVAYLLVERPLLAALRRRDTAAKRPAVQPPLSRPSGPAPPR
jgi:exopolysaccharide production protein ExoZ